MTKNRYSTDYTDTMKSVYRILAEKLGHSAKITDLWEILCLALGITEFSILDRQEPRLVDFESYLIETFRSWLNGEDMNFAEIRDKILEVGDFTKTEKLILQDEQFEDKLWAIYKVVLDPTLNI